MRRDIAARRPSARTLTGTALLLAAGAGTALGAGTASAAPTLPAVPNLPGAGLISPKALPAPAPNLSLTHGTAKASGQSHDVGNVSGKDLAALGNMTSGQFSGLGSS